MKITAAIQKLEKKGYKVTFCENCVLATKNQRTYKATTINGLVKLIF